MTDFHLTTPTLDSSWRAIILFGRNVASYKFALAEALLSLPTNGTDLVHLDELAVPYAKALCRHLQQEPKQNTQTRSAFLDACTQFTTGAITEDTLRQTTVRRGFDNVIDAFHIVQGGEVGVRFFLDERATGRGIRLTEDFQRLRSMSQACNLAGEAEARWRLVETAWRLDISNRLIDVEQIGSHNAILHAHDTRRRIAVTSAKPALNGYQKGRCFYCYRPVVIDGDGPDAVDVDHFFPHVLGQTGHLQTVNGVWNLVLACRDCNRGVAGKSARVPSITLLTRLHRRNEYYVSSHHPLRDTILAQTGTTLPQRQTFLQRQHDTAMQWQGRLDTWQPEPRAEATF